MGGATIGEITAHCSPGQPDGVASEIECGPISAAGLAPGARVGFVSTVGSAPSCAAPFQLDVTSTGTVPFTPANNVTAAPGCSSSTPSATKAPTLRGPAVAGKRLVATPPAWSTTPIGVTYRWQRCLGTRCLAIPGATTLAFTPSPKDVGHTVRIVATGTFGLSTVTTNSAKIRVRA